MHRWCKPFHMGSLLLFFPHYSESLLLGLPLATSPQYCTVGNAVQVVTQGISFQGLAWRWAEDCNVYMSELNSETAGSERSERPELPLNPGRQGYLLCAEGSVQISDSLGEQHELRQHDAAELKGPLQLKPTPKSRTALLILFEMKETLDLSEN